ncbi:right-handed parallel beta-helix repeat-containing protein [Candidatus Lokiarchaeum ossiferum]|uniref:right-handed parallel beta-helix repeat-containing protein n=1 Tax=Candidatus Lokiarchaeum ossiferum TaxID=2951803 RepID=UPI00352E340E
MKSFKKSAKINTIVVLFFILSISASDYKRDQSVISSETDQMENIEILSPVSSFRSNSLSGSSSNSGPIAIDGDDWTSVDTVTGSGTFLDPYVIANLVIEGNGNDGISIKNSASFGLIQNCTIYNGLNGISLDSSSNCHIFNNSIIENSGDGIHLSASTNCEIDGNNVTQNTGNGIFLWSSFDCNLTKNSVSNNMVVGITTYFSENYNLVNNTANNNLYGGYVLSEASNCNIFGNIAINNSAKGFILRQSINCNVENNSAITNSDDGMYCLFTSYSLLIHNNILNNSGNGLYLDSYSNYCNSTENNISYNFKKGIYLCSTAENNHISQNSLFKNVEGAILNEGVNNNINNNDIVECLNISFSISNTSPYIGENVSFQDNSTGGYSPLSYLWDFGDGIVTTLKNPEHNYSSMGIYNVSLTVSEIDGSSAKSTAIITVTHSPIFIVGNDWSSCDSVSGMGTFDDPYVIADLVIDAKGSDGISIENSQAYARIENCTVSNGRFGIFLNSSANCELRENYVFNNLKGAYFGYGIYLTKSSNCSLIKNTAKNNAWYGIMISHSFNCTLIENQANNNLYGIFLTRCSNSTLIKNTVTNNIWDGISISGFFNILKNNTVSQNGLGINIRESSDFFLMGNIVIKNWVGISISYSQNCSLISNNVSENLWDGISLFNSVGCNISLNLISKNFECGIKLTSPSKNCILSQNVILQNLENGIFLSYQTANNEIFLNYLSKNVMGAVLDEGMNNHLFDNDMIECLNASFASSKISVYIGEVVSFTDTSTGGNIPLSYLWDFGDGTNSSLQNLTHSFKTTGNYTILLIVHDSDGDSSSYNMSIVVTSISPSTNTTSTSTTTQTTESPIVDKIFTISGYPIGFLFISVVLVNAIIKKRNLISK